MPPTIDIVSEILEENGFRTFRDLQLKGSDLRFDLIAQNGDQVVIFELISDAKYAMSKMLQIQGKAGELRRYLGTGGKQIEIYAVVAVLTDVYEKLFRGFEEVRQNPIACRKLLLSIDSRHPETNIQELKSKLTFDLLPVLPFDESEIAVQDVDGLTILGEKVKDGSLAPTLIAAFQKGGPNSVKRAIEEKLKSIEHQR
jgi:hypothetical protein